MGRRGLAEAASVQLLHVPLLLPLLVEHFDVATVAADLLRQLLLLLRAQVRHCEALGDSTAAAAVASISRPGRRGCSGTWGPQAATAAASATAAAAGHFHCRDRREGRGLLRDGSSSLQSGEQLLLRMRRARRRETVRTQSGAVERRGQGGILGRHDTTVNSSTATTAATVVETAAAAIATTLRRRHRRVRNKVERHGRRQNEAARIGIQVKCWGHAWQGRCSRCRGRHRCWDGLCPLGVGGCCWC